MTDLELLLEALEDRRVALGSLRGDGFPLTWTEVGTQIGTHAATFSRIKSGQAPSQRTLARIFKWLGAEADQFESCGACDDDLAVTGATTLPVADRDAEWDGGNATARIFETATDADGTVDRGFVEQAFLYRDPQMDPNEAQAYKLPFADIVNGSLTIFPRAVAAVASGHGLVQAQIPDSEKKDIEKKICELYRTVRDKYEDWPVCPFTKKKTGEAGELAMDPTDEIPEEEIPDCSCDPEDEAYDPECDCEDEEDPKTAAIYGVGRLSDTKDERTAALVNRVRELLTEGAVGVSIRHDLDPASMPSREKIAELMAAEQYEELDALMAGVSGRPRHLAIVDTAAFSDARLTLGEDGFAVEGPITFEGIWTGDVRDMPYGGLTWDDDLLPIPIIWDPDNNDHDGVVVGYISSMERIDGMTTGVRPEAVEAEDVEAVVAAAGSDRLPAQYFAKFPAQAQTPFTIGEPDATGLRHVFGHAVPHGVCHRSDMSPCFQYPGDVDPQHRGFHTGSPVTLSDGSVIRVGALTLGGRHIDTGLARQGISWSEVNRHRDDANKILALIHVWEDRYGLAVSGVVLPGVSRDDLLRAKASAPSVEIWPKGSGRTLVGIHLVPTPAWPVAASAGSAEYQTMATSVEVLGDLSEPEDDDRPDDNRLDRVEASLTRIETALALLANELVTLPDAPVNE